MRRIFFAVLILSLAGSASAQNDTTLTRRILKPTEARSNDHFLIQLGYLSWVNKPDSINTSGLPRSFNMYLMLDFPFKTNPHWSVALGPGIATDHMFFDKTYVGVKDNTSSIRFQDLSDTSHFRKYKLTTAFAELPVELRYRFNPGNDRRSVKIALGAKIGTLLSAGVKGKDFQDKNENTLNDYTEKEKSKQFFNRTRLSVMGRVGFGHFTFFGAYSVTPLFREGQGPVVRPLTLGLTVGGL
ncbi:MAG TPA: outer membrane beta-barrel protein [Flavisolibacter sp.]|nr:outer membrane beta-barrel protein [Flavisolibacter sp.]